MSTFVHLHLHTEYSIKDSLVRIKPLAALTRENNMPAVAITDIMNLFGMVKFYKNTISAGIKPLIGAELWVANDVGPGFHKLVVLCQNKGGYQNLTQLITRAYQEGQATGSPLVQKAWIKNHHAGLIALSGAQAGEVGQALLNGSSHKAGLVLQEWREIFPNRYYVEVQKNNRAHEAVYLNNMISLAAQLQCPLVATNEVLFLKKTDFEAHQARVCIHAGVTLESLQSSESSESSDSTASSLGYTPEQYYRSAQEMHALFSDIPQAVSNTLEIAQRCSFALTLDEPLLPSFPVPAGESEESYLEKAAHTGLQERLKNSNEDPTGEYQARLNTELRVINSMGFSGYFLIVADFIQWAKSNNIPVGPGRGSGAGSLVAYVLGITDLDPIVYELLFERFLNPDRVSLPDFDIDFCMDNRDKVIDYVIGHYGKDRVSQIATFGTMAAKAVIRDVGRVLNHPYGFVDKIAKLIPFEIGMTLEKALNEEQNLKQRYEEEEEVKTLIDLAKKLEGITRNVGKHAGGVVIAPAALTAYAPLYAEENGAQGVIQFDKDDVEALGLIKFDFLGLRTLTIIDWAVQNSNVLLQKTGKEKLNIQNIPLNDPKTFALLKKCATTAVFQLESRGMKDLIKRLQPDHFEEIVALVALFRPGPLQSGMVDDFINRKHGRAKVEYPHPAIEPILKPTYGVILYQEQVMQIAQVLAGYTLGSADLLRRAMGKKKPEEMAKQRAIFTEGAVSRGVEEPVATYIFDLMEKFAGYGFNKSHSAAYALISYQTAWLKAHFQSSFMAAVLSADMNHTDKVVTMIEDCKSNLIAIIPPDVQHSDYPFTVNEQGQILYGLGAIKGVGENAIREIIEQRQKKGPYKDFFEFCARVDGRKVNRRVLESLIKSGSFDCFQQERAHMMATLEEAIKNSDQINKNLSFGQSDLFDFEIMATSAHSSKNIASFTEEERLQGEKESLGMYLSGHPLAGVEKELLKMGVKKFSQLKPGKKDQKTLIAGLVLSLKTIQTKKGDRMAILMIDDCSARYEVTIFPEPYQKYRDHLVKDQLLVLEVSVVNDNFSDNLKPRVQAVYTLVEARMRMTKKLNIKLNNSLSPDLLENLKTCLAMQERGPCIIYIHYLNQHANVTLKLDQKWHIQPTPKTVAQIEALISDCAVELEY